MATKAFDEIVQSFLTFLIRRNDLIDIKPTAITRTLIDSIANEIAVVNNEIENVRKIQTILNAATMSEEEMDNLAANYGVSRKGATFATTEVTFALTREPRSDVAISAGTVVSTATDPRNSGSVQFSTLESATFFADRINGYFNPATAFFETTVRARALTPGVAGNVSANSLSRTVGSFNVGSDVVLARNKIAATGGVDRESNEDLAARLFVSISGINVGTKDGYKKSALATPGVLDALVVGAGDPMMVRDLNSRNEHLGGRVDVYVQGQDLQESQDRVGAAFRQKPALQVSPIRGSEFEFYVPDPELETYPLVSVDRVYTIIENPIFKYEKQFAKQNVLSSEIVVTIVAPIDGSRVDGGVDVFVRAYKPGGNIVRVNLIINQETKDRMFFDEDSGFYKFTLNTLIYPDGLIQLEAEAIDEQTNIGKTEPIFLRVQNIKDVIVRIVSPDAGKTILSVTPIDVYAFSVAGINPRNAVEIRYNGGMWLPMNPTLVPNRWTLNFVPVSFPNGPVKIEVRAKDHRLRTGYALPRYVIVDTSPATTVRDNDVRSMVIFTESATPTANLSRSSGSGININTGVVTGNFNDSRIQNCSDPKLTNRDLKPCPILPDRQPIIDGRCLMSELTMGWVGTDMGIFLSTDAFRSCQNNVNSANTIGWGPKDDRVNVIKIINGFAGIGTDGGFMRTQDRANYFRPPGYPSNKPVLSLESSSDPMVEPL